MDKNNELEHSENIKARHKKRQEQRRRIMKIRRITFYTILCTIFILIILLFTPLFNIKNVVITGNKKVDVANIKQAIGSVEEENLFRLSKKKITKNVEDIPYVEKVTIKKAIFPVTIKVNIVESNPCAQILYGEKYAILDKSLKVLEIADAKLDKVCEIKGIEISQANEGGVISSENKELLDSALFCITTLSDEELFDKVSWIDFTDENNISFNYENRLDVLCGSAVDFEKKIGMFIMAINSEKLTSNSRGTINLSVTGKAIYTP